MADAAPTWMIRTVEPTDFERLVAMDEQITRICRRDWYKRKLATGPGDTHVSVGAEAEGTLVGAILGSVRYGEFGVPEPIFVLDTILVDRNHQGRGIATAMLERLACNLRAYGIERLRTELSWDEQRLNGFLTRRGFLPAPRVVLELELKSQGPRKDQAGGPAS